MTTVQINVDNRQAKRNVAVLFYAQAILGSQQSINSILGGLAGFALAGNKALATLPISVMLLASMLSAGPVSLFMGRFGRRAGFLLGAAAGLLGGGCSALALYVGRFDLLLLGAVLTGIFRSTHGYFRFAAADTASEEFKPKAISLVLAGGLLSAFIGPEIVRSTSDAIDSTPYAGAYLAVIAINVIGSLGLLFLDIPTPPRKKKGEKSGRDLKEIFTQPKTIVAVICAMVSYAVMTLVMTSTTLAMTATGFTTATAADVVRWHIIAMFAPSFFTGAIISRIGQLRVITIGLTLLGIAAFIGVSGDEVENFYFALIALGLGWNFGFIGATSLLTTTHTSEERAKVQGLNDVLVSGLVTIASFGSGAILQIYGWKYVQYAMIPALSLAVMAILWLAIKTRRARSIEPNFGGMW